MSTKTKIKARIKATRMWADYDPTAAKGTRLQVYNRKSEGDVLRLKQFPVAVLDASDEQALIEQAANALACEHMGAMEGTYSLTPESSCRKGSESAYMWQSARAVLSSLGIIRAKKRQTPRKSP